VERNWEVPNHSLQPPATLGYAQSSDSHCFYDSLEIREFEPRTSSLRSGRVLSGSVLSCVVVVVTLICKYMASSEKGKRKAVPLRSIEAHLGDRRYSSYSFLTSALEGGEWSASRPGRALPPDKEPPVPTVQEAGWAPEAVWTQRLEEKSSASVGDQTPAVVRHCTD
jgi:hypothetical protein